MKTERSSACCLTINGTVINVIAQSEVGEHGYIHIYIYITRLKEVEDDDEDRNMYKYRQRYQTNEGKKIHLNEKIIAARYVHVWRSCFAILIH